MSMVRSECVSAVTCAIASLTISTAACRSDNTPVVTDLAVASPAALPFRPHIDTIQGVAFTDPLRWMEDSTAAGLPEWLAAQRRYTDSVIARLVGRDSLEAHVTRIFQTAPTIGEVIETPTRRFVSRWIGRAPSLLMIGGGITTERMLLSDSLLAATRDGAEMRAFVPSFMGDQVAIGTTSRGDADATLHVLDVARGVLRSDRIPDLLTTTSGTRYEVTWLPDGSGFIYPRHWPGSQSGPPADRLSRGRQFVHRLGTPQVSDVPVFGFEVNPEVTLAPEDLPTRVHTAEGARWVVGSVFRSRQNGTDHLAAELSPAVAGKARWVRIASLDDRIGSIELKGDTVYAISRRGADRGAIVRKVLHAGLAVDQPWDVVVPERRGVITGFASAADAIYFTERDSGAVTVRRAAGRAIQAIVVPRTGSARLIRRGAQRPGAFFSVNSWAVPMQWFHVAPSTDRAERLAIDDGVASEAQRTIVSDRLEIASTDGAQVPVSVVYDSARLAGGALNGTAPLLVEAYGGFGSSTDPHFEPKVLAWIARGGVYAYAHVRGGGERGEAWHQAAVREGKQRSIDDMIATIEGLIARKYTGAGRVVITGTSFGANIPGLVMLQRPDLLGAVWYEVGQPDEIRGAAVDPTAARNIAEIGDLDTPGGVRLLMQSSPYHQVPAAIRLPAIIVHSADDDYNFGSHMLIAKYVARLQAANRGTRPIIWVRTPGGHSELFYLSPSWAATSMSFALWHAGDARFQPR